MNKGAEWEALLPEGKERRFEELISLRYAIYTGRHPKADLDVTVIAFEGDCGIGSGSNGAATFIEVVIRGALKAWSCEAIVLDFRKLKYVWGDMMSGAVSAGYDPRDREPSKEEKLMTSIFGNSWRPERPRRGCVIVSNDCREGLTSLLNEEMGIDAKSLLVDSVEEALDRILKQ